MVQLTAINVGEITQRHKYRWHVTTEKQIRTSLKTYHENILCIFQNLIIYCINIVM